MSLVHSVSSALWAGDAEGTTASYESWLAGRDADWIATLDGMRVAGDYASIRGHAEQGDAEAQAVLGEMLCDTERYDDAALWLRRAAEQGHAPAMQLAILLSAPAIGREADPQYGYRGRNWLSSAGAEGGYQTLADLFDHPCVPEQNRELTAKYLEALYFTEFPGSYMILAGEYENGTGVERSLVEAAALARVALQRSGEGYGAGTDYYRTQLADLEQNLSPDQRAAAEARAREWFPPAWW